MTIKKVNESAYIKSISVDNHNYEIIAMKDIKDHWFYGVVRDGKDRHLSRPGAYMDTKTEVYNKYPTLKKVDGMSGLP